MKNKRILDILEFLTQFDNYVSINTIAQALSVSNRTIRNDLDQLENRIKRSPITLLRTPGMGIKLEGSHKDKLELVTLFNQSLPQQIIQNADDRRNAIILRLLSNRNNKISDLMQEFFVSRATIQKDLAKIETLLEPFDLKLQRQGSVGTNIIGKERRMRNLMFEIMLGDASIPTLNNLLTQNTENTTGEYLFYGLDLTDDEIAHLIKIVELKIPTLKQAYTPVFLTHLFVRLLIVLKRHEINQDVTLTEAFKKELMQYEGTFEVAESLVESLNTYLKKTLPKDETTYIQAYVIAYLPGSTLTHHDTQQIQQFIEKLISKWSELLTIDFTKDSLLKQQLIEHLNAVYLRVKHGIQISNPLLYDILDQYPHTFEIVSRSIESLNDPLWVDLSQEEQGLLTLYLASALERKKKPLKTVLVTDFARSAQTILTEKIENHCREITIVDTIKFHDLSAYDLEKYDLIITTHELSIHTSTPHIVIKNLLNDDALIQLKKAVRSLFKTKNDPYHKNPID